MLTSASILGFKMVHCLTLLWSSALSVEAQAIVLKVSRVFLGIACGTLIVTAEGSMVVPLLIASIAVPILIIGVKRRHGFLDVMASPVMVLLALIHFLSHSDFMPHVLQVALPIYILGLAGIGAVLLFHRAPCPPGFQSLLSAATWRGPSQPLNGSLKRKC